MDSLLFVKVDSVVVHAPCITTPSRMLSVLALREETKDHKKKQLTAKHKLNMLFMSLIQTIMSIQVQNTPKAD